MTLARMLFLAGLAAISASGHAPQQEPSKADLFKWFDSLGFEDQLKGRFVCNEYFQIKKGVRSLQYREFGFLLPATPEGRAFMRLSLLADTVEDPGPDTNSSYEDSLRPVDFESTVREEIRRQTKYGSEPDQSMYSRMRTYGQVDKTAPWANSCEPFILSRVAEQRGLTQLSDELFKIAGQLSKADKTLASDLDESIGQSVLFGIQRDINNPEIPFAQIKTSVSNFLRLYPKHEGRKVAKSYAEALDFMAANDRSWAAKPKGSGEAAEIEALIHDLQNQFGQAHFTKGGASVLGFGFGYVPDGEAKTPATKLAALGYRAIPQLAAAIGDTRLTRAVSFNGYGPSADGVLRVGDAVAQILDAIIPDELEYESNQEDEAIDNARFRKAVEDWYVMLLRKGERQVLIDVVRSGEGGYRRCAEFLVKKYPEDAAPAIAIALDKLEKNDSTRSYLVAELSDCKAVTARELISHLFDNDSEFSVRMTVAGMLAAREPDRVMQFLLKAWNAGKSDDGVISLLLSSGKVEAVYAVEKRIKDLPVDLRLNVIESLGGVNYSRWRVESHDDNGEFDSGVNKPEFAEYFKAAERVLVSLLQDTEARVGMSGSSGDFEYDDPRICDMASHGLFELWPQKYKFEDFDEEQDMDNQRFSFANIWRKENGLPVLPAP